jgi:hypothetical protein
MSEAMHLVRRRGSAPPTSWCRSDAGGQHEATLKLRTLTCYHLRCDLPLSGENDFQQVAERVRRPVRQPRLKVMIIV